MKHFIKNSYKGALFVSITVTLVANVLLLCLMAFLQKGDAEFVKKTDLIQSEISVIKKSMPEPLLPEPRLSVAKKEKVLKKQKFEIKKTEPVNRKKPLKPVLIPVDKPVLNPDLSRLISIDLNNVVPVYEVVDKGSEGAVNDVQVQKVESTENRVESPVSPVNGVYNVGDVDQGPIPGKDNVKANYPLSARNLRLSGWVELGFVITENGNVESVKIIDSDGQSSFESSAVEALLKWTFTPARLNGRSVPVRCRKRIVFRLEE